MVKHDGAVCGHPGICLDTVGTEPLGQGETFQSVLGCMGPCAAVSKHDRPLEERGEELLHPGQYRAGLACTAHSYAGDVFNLSGSELMFLLVAGLVVFGPDRLPGIVRSVARTYADVKRAAQGVERDLRDAFAEPVEQIRTMTSDITTELEGTRDLFGTVDNEPSPPMRPEKSRGPEVLEGLGDDPAAATTNDDDHTRSDPAGRDD